jgi:hypothetical protein
MADEQKQNERNEKPLGDSKEHIHGRIHNSQNPALEQNGAQSDISSVDQQEGNMNHGETGGNLNKGNETK